MSAHVSAGQANLEIARAIGGKTTLLSLPVACIQRLVQVSWQGESEFDTSRLVGRRFAFLPVRATCRALRHAADYGGDARFWVFKRWKRNAVIFRDPDWLWHLTLDKKKGLSDEEKGELLGGTASHGLPRQVEWLVHQVGVVPNVVYALRVAAVRGHVGVVRVLLACEGVDPNLGVPLAWAAYSGRLAVVEALLADPRVDVHAVGNGNWTPLQRAEQRGHAAVAAALRAHGATR